MHRVAVLLVIGSLLQAGCGDPPKVIDPFPIVYDGTTGPVILAAATRDDAPLDIVLDVLSPVTVLDSSEPGEPVQEPRRRLVELTLFGLAEGSEPLVPRVRFPETAALDVHPCGVPGPCAIGFEVGRREIHGILGFDILSRTAIRFDFPDDVLRFFPDIAGSAAERTTTCEAVFDAPFAGGGTLVVGQDSASGSEITYTGRRPTLGVCLADGIPEEDLEDYGVDAQLAISTALGPSLLTIDAYERFRRSHDAPALNELPRVTLNLLSGPVQTRLVELPFVALTGKVGDASTDRGPCRERFANYAMAMDACNMFGIEDCPCEKDDEDLFCRAGAVVEISEPVLFAIVDDNLPMLQALRTELRPQIAELDGILGADALAKLRVDFDYPNGRILMDCANDESCLVRPQVRSKEALPALADCLAQSP